MSDDKTERVNCGTPPDRIWVHPWREMLYYSPTDQPEYIEYVRADTVRSTVPLDAEELSRIASLIRVWMYRNDFDARECAKEVLDGYVRANSVGREPFYVIERFLNGQSVGYWNGINSETFVDDIDCAIQFRRKEDAIPIRSSYGWRDVQITEHLYLSTALESIEIPKAAAVPLDTRPPDSLHNTCRRVWVCKRCGNCPRHCKHGGNDSTFHEDLDMPCSGPCECGECPALTTQVVASEAQVTVSASNNINGPWRPWCEPCKAYKESGHECASNSASGAQTCKHCNGKGKVPFMGPLTAECKYCNGSGVFPDTSPTSGAVPTFNSTKEAMLWAQKNAIPAVVPFAPTNEAPSVSAAIAEVERLRDEYQTQYDKIVGKSERSIEAHRIAKVDAANEILTALRALPPDSRAVDGDAREQVNEEKLRASAAKLLDRIELDLTTRHDKVNAIQWAFLWASCCTSGEWQPIETAPKDGTWQIVARIEGGKILWWYKSRFKGNYWRTSGGTAEPTHWMPLPAAPDAAITATNKDSDA